MKQWGDPMRNKYGYLLPIDNDLIKYIYSNNTFIRDTMILHWSVFRYEIIYFSAILDNRYFDRNADRDK